MNAITVDTGVYGSAAVWEGGIVKNIIEWGREDRTNGELLNWICPYIISIAENYNIDLIVVERPYSRQLRGGPFQFLMFEDLSRLCKKNDMRFQFLAPLTIKSRVCGNPRANKEDMKNAVINYFESRNKRFDVIPETEHGWDAIGVGIAYAERPRGKRREDNGFNTNINSNK